MSITSNRSIVITFEEDYIGNLSFPAAENITSPGAISILTLASGNNIITLPTGGSSVRGATIVPPAGNTVALTLKGVAGDTGIVLSKVDPTSIAFDTAPPASFVLDAGAELIGLRIAWS